MKNRNYLVFAILLHVSAFAYSNPETLKCGVYPVALYDFDDVNNEFSSIFYLWCSGSTPNLKIDKTMEVVNALKYEPKFADQSLKGSAYLTTTRYFAKVYHEWDMTNFPFDRQTLKIYLEDGVNDTDSLRFVTDTENSKVSETLILDDWKLESFKFSEEPHVYASGFGTDKEQSTYSRMVLTFEIKRQGWRNFLNYFLGFFVAILLSLLAFFARSERFSIIVGAVFSLIGTKFVLDQTMPAASGLSLSDNLELASFVFVLFTALLVTIDSRREDSTGKRIHSSSLKIMMVSLAVYLIYVGANVVIAYNS